MEKLESMIASATGGCNNMVASLAAAMNKLPMEKLASMMAFCEVPFDGTFDGTTSAPSSSGGAAGGSRASATNVPEAGGGGGEDAKVLRRAWLADLKKEWLLPRDKAGTGVDGLTILETVALQ